MKKVKKNKFENTLGKVNTPKDLKKLSQKDLFYLCADIRNFMIESVSKTGGHLGSNLGVVELTVALHRVFDTPRDFLIWDVGHQAYPHKIITGRKDKMHTIRKKDGLAPFPKREESEYDAFGMGHSSTSISVATGLAIAHRSKKKSPQIVAIIGDGALTGGMAMEALNHAGDAAADILVILNDNRMSISPNVGGMSKYLTRLMSSPSYDNFRKKGRDFLGAMPSLQEFVRKAELYTKGMITPGTFFEELGFAYYGPIDGHDVKNLIQVLGNLKKIKGPKFLHIVTTKGKGYAPAERDCFSLHAVKPFNPKTGKKNPDIKNKLTFAKIFSDWVCDKADSDKKLHAITPAMGLGSGLREFSERFSARYHDVGIAEQHAVTFAAGLACANKKPVVAIYSSFLQRAYDQLIHDVALQKLDVLFAVDRAGIVGGDGATHNGSFDLSFGRLIPNLVIMAPADENECYRMLETGYNHKGPVMVRYPRGGLLKKYEKNTKKIAMGKAKLIREGENIAILAYGTMLGRCKGLSRDLDATLINMRFVKPLDEALLKKLSQNHKYFITVEDNAVMGGAGSAVNEFFMNNKIEVFVKNLGLPDDFLAHGSRDEMLAEIGLDEEGIKKSILDFVNLK